jgi:hypothetical protein
MFCKLGIFEEVKQIVSCVCPPKYQTGVGNAFKDPPPKMGKFQLHLLVVGTGNIFGWLTRLWRMINCRDK